MQVALTSPDSRDAGGHDITQYVEVELGLAHLEASDLEAGDECSFADGQHSMAPQHGAAGESLHTQCECMCVNVNVCLCDF